MSSLHRLKCKHPKTVIDKKRYEEDGATFAYRRCADPKCKKKLGRVYDGGVML
jgi:hypothetical protein